MILKMKSYFYQIYKIIFLLLLSSISNLYAHNLFNGGCKEHCGQKVKVTSNNNKLKNIDDQINIQSKNSCLNKSLCRGWRLEIFKLFYESVSLVIMIKVLFAW